jgi:hypothetical protein
MLRPSPSPDTFRFVMRVRQFNSITDGYQTFWIDLTVVTCMFQCSFNYFSQITIVQRICHWVSSMKLTDFTGRSQKVVPPEMPSVAVTKKTDTK